MNKILAMGVLALPLLLGACPSATTGGVSIDGQITPQECVIYNQQIAAYEAMRGADGTLPAATAARLASLKALVAAYCLPPV